MKLVDILARKIIWPEGLECLSQLQHNGSIINGKGLDGRVWAWLEIAEDTPPAGVIVTKAEWQAAVDAMRTDYPVEWDGEGLPPVGTVCEVEVATDADSMDKRPEGWHRTTILAHYAPYGDELQVAICPVDRKVYQRIAECFRPIRTPEQIAADERESAVNGMLCHDALGGSRRGLAEALYDAGYRKQEPQ